MKKYENEQILSYLRKINRIAYECNKLKREAYKEREHIKCQEYKRLQKRLYLLKSLVLIELVERGIVKMGKPCIDVAGNLVETFTVSGSEQTFHSPSLKMPEENVDYEILRKNKKSVKNLFWRPYATILERELTGGNKEIYERLVKNNFELEGNEREKFIDILKNENFTAKIEGLTSYDIDWNCEADVYFCNFYKNNCKIGEMEIIISEKEDLKLIEENGILQTEDSWFLDLDPDCY